MVMFQWSVLRSVDAIGGLEQLRRDESMLSLEMASSQAFSMHTRFSLAFLTLLSFALLPASSAGKVQD